jgi:hypothetical protein
MGVRIGAAPLFTEALFARRPRCARMPSTVAGARCAARAQPSARSPAEELTAQPVPANMPPPFVPDLHCIPARPKRPAVPVPVQAGHSKPSVTHAGNDCRPSRSSSQGVSPCDQLRRQCGVPSRLADGMRSFCPPTFTMKVARSGLPVTLAHWERPGVRETVMAAATYSLWGGADAMIVGSTGPLGAHGHGLVRRYAGPCPARRAGQGGRR